MRPDRKGGARFHADCSEAARLLDEAEQRENDARQALFSALEDTNRARNAARKAYLRLIEYYQNRGGPRAA